MNESLAKAIYVSGAPLAMVEHPLWKEFFNKLRPSYHLPSRKQISTVLLDSQYEKTKQLVEQEIKNANVLHLQCDGWSNLRNESIINFVVTQPKPYFVDFVATEANRHTGQYLGAQIEKCINNYGSDKFFSGIGDNAASMQAGLRIGTEKYPHIHIFGCVAHALNLLCKDILKLSSSNKVFVKAKKVIKKIKNSHILHSLFTQKQREKEIKVTLKLPPETRWGYAMQALESLIANKGILRLMAADPDTAASFDPINATIDEEQNDDEPELPGEVKKLILDDQFWLKVEGLHEILQPIVACLTQLETDDVIIHKAHKLLSTMFATVDSLVKSSIVFDARDKKNAEKCVEDRKNKTMKPIMLSATVLDPAEKGSHLTEEEVMDGIGFIFESAKKVKLDEEAVMTELTNYRAKAEIWSKEFVWVSCANVSPLVWWKSFFGHTALGKIAEKILTTPLTSTQTERSFSTFGSIHTKKRNRLTTERSGKITYIAHNYKLMQATGRKRQNEEESTSTSSKRLRHDESSDESSDDN